MDGTNSSAHTTSLSNIHTFPSIYDTVQTQVSQKSPKPTPPLIARRSLYITPLSTKSSHVNSTRDDTQDPSPAQKLKSESDPSKHPPSPWFPSQGSRTSFVSYKTYPFRETTQPYNPSITHSILMPSHALGEPSLPFAPSSTTFLLAYKEHAETSLRHTEPSHWPQINGQVWLCNSTSQAGSQSTNATRLVAQQQEACSDSSQTLWLTYVGQKALDPQANGSTTKSSFASSEVIWTSITK